jgi:hypothetical protein
VATRRLNGDDIGRLIVIQVSRLRQLRLRCSEWAALAMARRGAGTAFSSPLATTCWMCSPGARHHAAAIWT